MILTSLSQINPRQGDAVYAAGCRSTWVSEWLLVVLLCVTFYVHFFNVRNEGSWRRTCSPSTFGYLRKTCQTTNHGKHRYAIRYADTFFPATECGIRWPSVVSLTLPSLLRPLRFNTNLGNYSLSAFELQRPHVDNLETQLYRTVRQRGDQCLSF